MDIIQLTGFISAYFLGAVPINNILTKQKNKKDGVMSTLYAHGKKLALLVLLGNIIKGLISITILAKIIFSYSSEIELQYVQIFCGFFTIIGSVFTAFNQFNGSKGIAVYLGIILGLYPTAFLFCSFTFIFTIIRTKYASISAIFTACSLPFYLFIIVPLLKLNLPPFSLVIIGIIMPWFIVFNYRKSLQRISKKEERKFKFKQ